MLVQKASRDALRHHYGGNQFPENIGMAARACASGLRAPDPRHRVVRKDKGRPLATAKGDPYSRRPLRSNRRSALTPPTS